MRTKMPRIGDLTANELHNRLDGAAMRELISLGRDRMPGFAAVLGPEQIASVVAHVRSLRKK